MGDEHEAHGDAHGAPEQIKHTVAQHDADFSVYGAGGVGEGFGFLEAGAQNNLLPVDAAPPSAPGRGLLRWPVGHGVGPDAGDQVPAGAQQRQDDLGGGVVGVGDQQAGCGNPERQQHGRQLVQLRAAVAVAEDNALVDAAGQGHGEASPRGAHRQRDDLARMAEDVFGLGVAFRLLVQFLDSRHLPSGLGYLDAVGQEDGVTPRPPRLPLQKRERRPGPEARQALRIEPRAMEQAGCRSRPSPSDNQARAFTG